MWRVRDYLRSCGDNRDWAPEYMDFFMSVVAYDQEHMAGIATLSGSISYTYATLSAVSLIAAAPTIVIFVLLQRFVTSGILLGAVKK